MTGGGRHVTTRQNWPASRLCRLFWPGQCRSARLSVPRSGAGRSASVRALADILPPAPAARQALARSLGFDATIYGNSSNISARIHGTKGGRFLIAPTDWQGEVPLVATLFRVATLISWILLRVLLHSPKGLPPTTALQDRLRIKPVEPGTVPTQWPDGRDESAVGFMRILDFVLRTCGASLARRRAGVQLPVNRNCWHQILQRENGRPGHPRWHRARACRSPDRHRGLGRAERAIINDLRRIGITARSGFRPEERTAAR